MSFGLGGDFDLFSVLYFSFFSIFGGAVLFTYAANPRKLAACSLVLSLSSVLGFALGRRDILIIHFDFCAGKQRVAKWGIDGG